MIVIEHKGKKDLLKVLRECVNVDADNFFPLIQGNKKCTWQRVAWDYAKEHAKLKRKDIYDEEETYNSIIGDITEAFFEVYAKLLLVNNAQLRVINHTSYDKFYVGFDLIGFSGPNGDIPTKFQIKYRTQQKGKEHKFTQSELFTFFARAEEEKISRDFLFLVDFCSSLTESKSCEVFTFNREERDYMFKRCRVITGRMMQDNIIKTYQNDCNMKHPLTIFYEQAITVIENS
jgi:hypothetical protein